MNNYFFRKDFYETRYNCSAFSPEEWKTFGTRKPVVAACFVLIGVSTQALYIPFLICMLQKKFRDMSCYKIMFFLGIVDMGNIIVGSYITAYLTWHGAVFCTHPRLIYFTGLVGVSSWCSACLTCVLLAFNRCIDFARPDLSDVMFAGYRTWLWLLLPTGYFMGVFFFEMPVMYDSNYVTWFYDPLMNAPIRYNFDYSNTTHAINNVAVIFILCAENAFLCTNIFKLSGNLSSSIKRKRQFLMQTLTICTLIVLAAAVYVYMNFFYVPAWLTTVGSLAYAANSGSPALIYLILNDNLRRASFRLFTDSFQKISHRSTIRSVSINNQEQPSPRTRSFQV